MANADYVAVLEELVATQDSYIAFLNKANETPIGSAYAHGWRCPQADIDRGAEFRKRIADLQARLEA
jgi:hypothetical protein